MEKQLFRQQSLDSISSPEQLHDYMRVTNPRLWAVLAAIIVLLAGFIAYASTATMENTIPVQINLESFVAAEGTEQHTYASMQLPISMKDVVGPGMEVRFAGEKAVINSTYTYEDEVGVLLDLSKDFLSLPNGLYDGELVLESTTPISFLLN